MESWPLSGVRKGHSDTLSGHAVVFSPEEENEQHACYVLERFDLGERKDVEVTKQYHFKISKRVCVLKHSGADVIKNLDQCRNLGHGVCSCKLTL
jgi:hypothetical protein